MATNPLASTILTLKQKYNQEDLPEYDLMRKRLNQQLREQEQVQREGLERSFARLGGGPAGAAIKAQQELETGLGKQRIAAEESVAGQELAMRRQLAEAEKQRQFAVAEREATQAFGRGEREATQEFTRKQFQEQLGFARGEREAQQAFAAGERRAGELFTRGERESSQDFTKRMADLDMAFKEKVFSFEKDSKLKELDFAEKQFALDRDIAQFNKQIAMMEANKPTDLMGSLFGPAFSTSQGPVGNVLGSVGSILKPVGSAIGSIRKLCFLKGTLIQLDDGSKKPIEKLELNDEVLLGGRVYLIGSSLSDNIYKYANIYLTGSHAVFEDGKFIRVKDSKIAEDLETSKQLKIYFIATKNHLLVSNDILFSDFHESDNLSLTEDESLVELNQKLHTIKEVQSWLCK